jgi:hypothetical protein
MCCNAVLRTQCASVYTKDSGVVRAWREQNGGKRIFEAGGGREAGRGGRSKKEKGGRTASAKKGPAPDNSKRSTTKDPGGAQPLRSACGWASGRFGRGWCVCCRVCLCVCARRGAFLASSCFVLPLSRRGGGGRRPPPHYLIRVFGAASWSGGRRAVAPFVEKVGEGRIGRLLVRISGEGEKKSVRARASPVCSLWQRRRERRRRERLGGGGGGVFLGALLQLAA